MPAVMRSLLVVSALMSIGNTLPHRSNSNSTPTIPLNEVAETGTSSLPSPTSTLKFIGLQLGTQNYTCNSTTGSFTNTGALARVFDATTYLTNNPDKVDSLSQTYLDLYTSLPCSQSPSTSIIRDDRCEDQANLRFSRPLPPLGQHYFTSSGTPTFDLSLSAGHPFLFAKKLASVAAPSTDDIAWLFLSSNGSAKTNMISSVYRLETAAGVAPSRCTSGETTAIPYAAEYWFYV